VASIANASQGRHPGERLLLVTPAQRRLGRPIMLAQLVLSAGPHLVVDDRDVLHLVELPRCVAGDPCLLGEFG
jgi:hypothetical protein